MKSSARAIIGLAMMLTVPASMYGVGYFAYGEPAEWYDDGSNAPVLFQRHYPSQWPTVVFRPVAWLESTYRGVPVELTYRAPEAIR
jgi:hypothetical protein